MKILQASLLFLLMIDPAPAQDAKTMHHISGTFEVKVTPSPEAGDGLSRFKMEKQIHGDLEATAKGEMIGGGDYKTGNAGYVAGEIITGTLGGKHGSFGLQHMTTMINGKPDMRIIVIPGSGTGELAGIAGTFTIIIDAQGKHSYTFDYTLP